MYARPDLRQLGMWLATLALAACGGAVANLAGTPLPWLLGAMVATAAALLAGVRPFGRDLVFPQSPRTAFIAIIGIAIGGSAEPGMWAEAATYWMSLLTLPVFVALAHMANYQFFRRIAGYDRPTAYYCATPGG